MERRERIMDSSETQVAGFATLIEAGNVVHDCHSIAPLRIIYAPLAGRPTRSTLAMNFGFPRTLSQARSALRNTRPGARSFTAVSKYAKARSLSPSWA